MFFIKKKKKQHLYNKIEKYLFVFNFLWIILQYPTQMLVYDSSIFKCVISF